MPNLPTRPIRRLELPDLDLLKVYLYLRGVKARTLAKALGISSPRVSNALAGRRPLPERLWVALYELAGLECPLLAPFDSKPRLWGVPAPKLSDAPSSLCCDRLTLVFDRLAVGLDELARALPPGWSRPRPRRSRTFEPYREAVSAPGLYLAWAPCRGSISPVRLDWTPAKATPESIGLVQAILGELDGLVTRLDIAVDYPGVLREAVEIVGVQTRTGEIRHGSGRSSLVPYEARGTRKPDGRHSRCGSAKGSHWRCYPHPVDGTEPREYVTRIEAQVSFPVTGRLRLSEVAQMPDPFRAVEAVLINTPLPYPHDVVLRDLWRFGPDYVRVRFGNHGRWRQFLSSLKSLSDHYILPSPSVLFDERWADEAARVQQVFGVAGAEHA